MSSDDVGSAAFDLHPVEQVPLLVAVAPLADTPLDGVAVPVGDVTAAELKSIFFKYIFY